MTDSIAQAEDLTQDAFLQVFRKLSTFREIGSVYLAVPDRGEYRVMHFRKKALKQVSLDDISNQTHRATTQPRCAWNMAAETTGSTNTVERIMLARAITDLPAGYRTIFLLHEVEGYEHEEIAQIMDFSVGNSKSQLYKAKRRIREFLSVSAARTDLLGAPGDLTRNV